MGAEAAADGPWVQGLAAAALSGVVLGGMYLFKDGLRKYYAATSNTAIDVFPLQHARASSFGVPADRSQRYNSRPEDVLAEEITADILSMFEGVPGVRVIHGLSSRNAPLIHHAVVYGNKVALINSVLWQSGRYEMSLSGAITCNGIRGTLWKSDLYNAVQDLKSVSTPETMLEVQGWTFVHAPAGEVASCKTSRHASVHLSNPYEGLGQIVGWFKEDKPIVDRKVLHLLWKFKKD